MTTKQHITHVWVYEMGLCYDFTQADFPEITLLWATLPEASGQQLRAEVLE